MSEDSLMALICFEQEIEWEDLEMGVGGRGYSKKSVSKSDP